MCAHLGARGNGGNRRVGGARQPADVAHKVFARHIGDWAVVVGIFPGFCQLPGFCLAHVTVRFLPDIDKVSRVLASYNEAREAVLCLLVPVTHNWQSRLTVRRGQAGKGCQRRKNSGGLHFEVATKNAW